MCSSLLKLGVTRGVTRGVKDCMYAGTVPL